MAVTYGSKRLVVGAHYGWRDFLVQRVSGIVIALFVALLLLRLVFASGPVGYEVWAGIFAPQWMKALTFAAFVGLIWHTWIGMLSIWYDYAKPAGLRLLLQAITAVWLVSCGGWAVQVLWRL